MVQSMTGFGQQSVENDQLSVSIEIKTLNSKNADCNIKMSSAFSDKEIEIRNLLTSKLQRGKILLLLNYASKREDSLKAALNTSVIKSYYNDLKSISDDLNESNESLLQIVMTMPEVYQKENNEDVLAEDWPVVLKAIKEAIDKTIEFRTHEGEALEKALRGSIEKISEYLEEVKVLDPQRIDRLKEKLKNQIAEYENNDNFDPSRFEQELIFYIEKLDINEEKVRLTQHLKYFIQTLDTPQSNGKKLGFIAQEIGREINTIGSKANDVNIQKVVVNMKDELEKIKEQNLNIL
ncbi:YicC family protein [Flammeovirga yaeyamensis]|uniref:YicC family protein n=2 Tax=Flammeovirga yaeyamensis TaxID=367791 RepID=A0AAX1NCP7_9BACT|nr:YicC/YloC family endoribonuclease [Flammeovirga sp. MY04]ANQ47730.1 YicC family protein [Flammeovirga sp. MY04]NMF37177.1 YicC family protein [Flammeovirga yaeyamensis]QWG03995.1 YicC family protein [Flammeovirga yaeyamensis]